jgi:hypothetical protein
MLSLLRERPVLRLLVLLTAAVALFAPPALAPYRCQTMGTTTSSPCCSDYGKLESDSGAQIEAERCCTKLVVLVERAPSDLSPTADAPPLLAVGTTHAAATVVGTSTGIAPAWTHGELDTGPPLILSLCTLLI